MKLYRIVFALFFSVALCLASTASFASKAGQLLTQAQADVAKAEMPATTTADRVDSYKDAVKLYEKIQSTTEYQTTPENAEAMYEEAVLWNTAKDKTIRDPYQAYMKLNSLISMFSERDLNSVLEKSETEKVQKTVADAVALKAEISDKLDKEKSHTIQYKILDFLVALTGRRPNFSYWFAIVLLTLIVKTIISPLTKAQFKAMKEMQRVAPLIKELQEKYKGDQKTIGEKTMDLYKEHHINPFASCLPLLVQMPILMGLYYTIRSYEFQFQKATFFWIGSSMSHMYHFSSYFTRGQMVWLTARNLAEPDIILVVLYAISMYISTKLSAVDPTQAEQQKMMAIVMPVMFSFIFMGFQSAFLFYWLFFNILQTGQQYLILRGGKDEIPLVSPSAEKPADDSGGSARIQRRSNKKKK